MQQRKTGEFSFPFYTHSPVIISISAIPIMPNASPVAFTRLKPAVKTLPKIKPNFGTKLETKFFEEDYELEKNWNQPCRANANRTTRKINGNSPRRRRQSDNENISAKCKRILLKLRKNLKTVPSRYERCAQFLADKFPVLKCRKRGVRGRRTGSEEAVWNVKPLLCTLRWNFILNRTNSFPTKWKVKVEGDCPFRFIFTSAWLVFFVYAMISVLISFIALTFNRSLNGNVLKMNANRPTRKKNVKTTMRILTQKWKRFHSKFATIWKQFSDDVKGKPDFSVTIFRCSELSQMEQEPDEPVRKKLTE